MARLADVDETDLDELDNATAAALVVDAPDRAMPLAEQRRGAVLAAVRASGARTVGDFGCGAGALIKDLLAERGIERIVAADVSAGALRLAARNLRLDTMPEPQRARLQIFQSALTYRDERLAGLDAAVLMEVIEHIDPSRLAALGRTVFGAAAPQTVIVTTPNAEYNVRFATLPAGAMRHRDHRFEWTRVAVPRLGRRGRRAGTATRFAISRSARKTRNWVRRRSWRSSARRRRHDPRHHRPRAEPDRADRRHRLGQVDLRADALPPDRGDLVGLLPGARGR